MRRPIAGEQIRIESDMEGGITHIATIEDVLSTQIRSTYEVTKAGDSGWREVSVFCFYADIEWDVERQAWKGTAQ